VNVSARTQYACIAILELALHYESGRPLRLRDIAESQGIPSPFLVQILLQLKGAGLVGSTRGAAGGYRLLRPPGDITLGLVMELIEGKPQERSASTETETAVSRALLGVWQEIAATQRQLLASISFADLLEQVRRPSEPMYYI
jgi:Rrf2 family protein